METSVGIDVGKHTLDVAVSGQRYLLRFANTPTGWGELIAVLASLGQPCIVLEATNRYHEGVTAALAEVGQSVTVANPLHTAAFRRSEASLAKTDALDARMLQRFAAQKRPAPSPRPDPTQRQVRELVRTREDLVSLRTRLTLQAGDLPPSTTPRSWPRSPTRSPSPAGCARSLTPWSGMACGGRRRAPPREGGPPSHRSSCRACCRLDRAHDPVWLACARAWPVLPGTMGGRRRTWHLAKMVTTQMGLGRDWWRERGSSCARCASRMDPSRSLRMTGAWGWA